MVFKALHPISTCICPLNLNPTNSLPKHSKCHQMFRLQEERFQEPETNHNVSPKRQLSNKLLLHLLLPPLTLLILSLMPSANDCKGLYFLLYILNVTTISQTLSQVVIKVTKTSFSLFFFHISTCFYLLLQCKIKA